MISFLVNQNIDYNNKKWVCDVKVVSAESEFIESGINLKCF